MTSDPEAALAAARAELQKACKLLEGPSDRALAECSQALEAVESRLRACLGAPPGFAAPRLRELAFDLRQSTARVRRLLASAEEYHARWSERLSLLTGCYSAAGLPVPAARAGRMTLEA